MNILIIEDDLGKIGNGIEVLTQKGHTCTIARSKESALKETSTQTFDLIISDLGLPEKDCEPALDSFSGINILEEISRKLSKKTYVIIASRAATGDGELTTEQEKRLSQLPYITVKKTIYRKYSYCSS